MKKSGLYWQNITQFLLGLLPNILDGAAWLWIHRSILDYTFIQAKWPAIRMGFLRIWSIIIHPNDCKALGINIQQRKAKRNKNHAERYDLSQIIRIWYVVMISNKVIWPLTICNTILPKEDFPALLFFFILLFKTWREVTGIAKRGYRQMDT